MSTTITVSVCDVDCAQATNNALAATPTIACLTTVKLRDQKTTTLIPCDQIGGGSGDGGPSTSSFCVATMSTPVPGVLCKTQLSDPTCYVHAAQVSCAPATATTSSSDLSPTSTTGSSPTPNSQTPGSQFSPTSTSPTIATSKKDPKAGYVPPGAAAGIGIGAALAGAVIAALIFFFVLQRFKKRNRQPQLSAYAQHVGPYPDAARQEKSTMVAVTGGASSIDSYLPQPAADDAITGDMSRLRDKIKDHVQSYYHVSPISPQMVDPSKLQDVARAVGISPQRMQELLLNPHSRIPAIRLYLAWLILSRCGGQGQARSSFLPAEVASFAPFIAGMDKTNNGQVALASKWKSISGTLLQSRYGPQQSAEDDVLEHNIRQAIAVADSVLNSFIGSPSEATSDKRLRNLEGIMRRAAQFAFLLFSQPSDWVFDWIGGSSGSQQGRLIVFPGLLQTVTDEGYAQRPPRLLSEPEVMSGL